MNRPRTGALQSSRVRGILWLVAAALMLMGPAIFNGNPAITGVGILFLIFGLVTLRRN